MKNFHLINTRTFIEKHIGLGTLNMWAYNIRLTDISILTKAPEDTGNVKTIYVITDQSRVDKQIYDNMKSHNVPIWYLSTSGVNSRQVVLPKFMQEDLRKRIISRNVIVGGLSELHSAIRHIATFYNRPGEDVPDELFMLHIFTRP